MQLEVLLHCCSQTSFSCLTVALTTPSARQTSRREGVSTSGLYKMSCALYYLPLAKRLQRVGEDKDVGPGKGNLTF